MARPVDREKAVRAAHTLWQQKMGESVRGWSVNDTSFLNIYCLCNERGGVVFLSKDDCVHPVVGYSAEGSPFPMPENALAWMNDRDREIGFCVANGLTASKDIVMEWEILVEGLEMLDGVGVLPLVQTRWNQSPLYNNLCPPATGTHSVTGCVATATAQVMRYWNHPATGTGSHCYTHANYGQLCADFGQTTYDWANMPTMLSASSTSAQIQAVATLCYHCGVAVEMDYDPSGSGASTYDVVAALQNYFGYKNTVSYVYRSSYATDAAWINLLANELNHGRPMLYRGSDANGGGGHSFVCDGYDGGNGLHFNWGWGGSMDGYYTVTAMNPGSYAFTVSQAAVIGIQPASAFTVSPTNLSVASSSETVSFDIQSIAGGGSWTVSSNVSWLTTSPSSGSGTGSVQSVTVTASANTSSSPRTGTIVVAQGSHQAVVTVVQDGYCPVQSLPFFEGFESAASRPTCWSEVSSVGTHDWAFQMGGYAGHPASAHSGTSNAAFLHTVNNTATKLVTPELDLSSAYCPYLNFYMANADWSGDVDELRVYYRSSPSSAWTELGRQEEAHADWTLMSYFLPHASNRYQIAFEGVDHYGYGVEIDDVRVFDSIGGVPPVVPLPSDSVITMGEGTSSGYNAPYNNFYKNSWNECRYAAHELGYPCVISHVAYQVASSSSFGVDTVRVYMGVTDNATFENGYDWTPLEDLTLVYEGANVTLGAAAGWEPIDLNRPFLYTDTSKALVVVVSKKAPSYTSALRYACSTVSSTVLYRQSDSDANYANYPNGGLGTVAATLPNIRLTAITLPGIGVGGSDTVIVNNFIHDTTIVYVPVHDTTVVNNYIHDTTFVDVYVPVHDTTIVIEWIHDTLTIVEDITYYDLNVVSANVALGLVAGSGRFPVGTEVEIAAIPIEGNRFAHWDDGSTNNPRKITVDSNVTFEASFETSTQSVVDVNAVNHTVGVNGSQIIVKNAEGQQIRIFDVVGRCLSTTISTDRVRVFNMPVTGVYLVQVGNYLAEKVVVVK